MRNFVIRSSALSFPSYTGMIMKGNRVDGMRPDLGGQFQLLTHHKVSGELIQQRLEGASEKTGFLRSTGREKIMDEREKQELSIEVRQILREVLREEMAAAFQDMVAGNFYKNLALEMESGIGEMYTAITDVKKLLSTSKQTADTSQQILSDASGQLQEIVNTTEDATNQIMDAVENCQLQTDRLATFAANAGADCPHDQVAAILAALNNDFMTIITACSFQDLTGQRVKQVVELIGMLEKKVVKLLVTAGVKIKEKEAGKKEHEIAGETQKVLAKLHGPQANGPNQDEVDALLASLM